MKSTTKLFSTFFLLFLMLATFSYSIASNVKANPESSAVASVGTPINWAEFWKLFNQYAIWDLEWLDDLTWKNVNSDLQVIRTFPEPNHCKFTLVFDASHSGDYRLTFTINKALRDYIERLEKWQVDIHFEDMIITFDWSDCAKIIGLKFNYGLKEVHGEQYFWFEIRRDNVPLNAHVEIDPSLVGTSTTMYATYYPFQRKTFYANGRFWVFYSDGTYMVYATSVDGVSWSYGTVRSSTQGNFFSIWFDGTYLHYAYAFSSKIYYRRGIPNSNGTITWSTDIEQTVSTAYNCVYYTFVSVDSDGYVWIGYWDFDGSNHYPYVIKSQYNNGSWGTTPSGFPYQLSTYSSANWRVSVIPLTNGKMLAVYARDSNTVKVKRWNGTAWGAEKATASIILYGYYFSAVAQGDDVHLVFLGVPVITYDILYTKYVYASDSFSAEVTVKANVSYYSAPVLSMSDNNTLYCFWATKSVGYPPGSTPNHVYYQISTDGGNTWSSPIDWIDETTEVLYYADRLTCFYKQYGSYIGLAYMTNTTSPYNVKFNFLTLPIFHTAESWSGTFTTIRWMLAEVWTGALSTVKWILVEIWKFIFPFSYTYYLRLGMTFTALIGLLLAPTLAVLGVKFKKKEVLIAVFILYVLVFALIHIVTNMSNME